MNDMKHTKTMQILLTAFAMAVTVSAQNNNGGISQEMLRQIEQSQGTGSVNKALFNAIAANSIDNLAKSFENQGELDTYFSTETKKQSIHDQKSSGRCWLFSGLNVLRSDFALSSDSLSVEYSQA